jgi:hypothetical protein
MTGSQALAALRSDGYLSGALITSGMTLDASLDGAWLLEDFKIEADQYGIQSDTLVRQNDKPRFMHGIVEGAGARGISSGTSGGIYGGGIQIGFLNVYGGVDGIKGTSDMDAWAVWVHGLDHPDKAHTDCLQIRNGLRQVYRWCVLESFNAYGTGAGVPGNGALQTGSMTADASMQMLDCWVDGGGYTIRMGTSAPPLIDFQFRRNKHGRGFTSGPVNGDASQPSTYGGLRYDDTNVWEDTGLPVLSG